MEKCGGKKKCLKSAEPTRVTGTSGNKANMLSCLWFYRLNGTLVSARREETAVVESKPPLTDCIALPTALRQRCLTNPEQYKEVTKCFGMFTAFAALRVGYYSN